MCFFVKVLLLLVCCDMFYCSNAGHLPKLVDKPKTKKSHLAWPANVPLSLKCKAYGGPKLRISWFKGGALVQQSARIYQDKKWSLKFRKPQLNDSGIYTCAVSNDFGHIKHIFNLNIIQRIQSPPALVPGYPKSVTARVGDNVEIECLEKPSNYLTHYRWLKSDSPVISQDKGDKMKLINPRKYKSFQVNIGNKQLYGVKLQLKHVTKDDEGYYTCHMSNSNGASNGTAYLKVNNILPSDPPEFLIPKEKRHHFVAVTEDEDVKFSCLVRGGAPLKYKWFFDKKLLTSDKRHLIEKSQLVIKNVQRADSGVYTCRIMNDYGHIKHSTKLKVLAKEPQHTNHPVLLAGHPKNKTAQNGSSVSLYCADTSGLLLDYRWLKWESSVKIFSPVNLKNASLFTIIHPSHYEQASFNKKGVYLKLKNLTKADEGLYTCLAVSIYMSFAYRSAYVTVKEHEEKSTSVNSATSTSWLTNITETRPPNINNTTSEKKISSTLTPTYSCFQFDENLQEGDLLSPHPKCHTKRACATLLNDQNGFTKFFCDEGNLCDKYNFNISKCHQITSEETLCCCHGELCNQPNLKLFQNTIKTEGHGKWSAQTNIIFFSTVIIGVSLALALIGYSFRRRKAALKNRNAQENRPVARKSTKKTVMQTRWMKEDP